MSKNKNKIEKGKKKGLGKKKVTGTFDHYFGPAHHPRDSEPKMLGVGRSTVDWEKRRVIDTVMLAEFRQIWGSSLILIPGTTVSDDISDGKVCRNQPYFQWITEKIMVIDGCWIFHCWECFPDGFLTKSRHSSIE